MLYGYIFFNGRLVERLSAVIPLVVEAVQRNYDGTCLEGLRR